MTAKSIEDILRETKIYQILRPKLVHANADISLKNALDIMHHEKAGYMVIVDAHLKVIGMFTEREVLMNVLKPGVSLSDSVSKYMRADIHTLKKTDNVGAALKAMHDFSIRHIPLVDEFGQLNGVLSIRTIVTFLAELLPGEVFNLPPKSDQMHDTVEGG